MPKFGKAVWSYPSRDFKKGPESVRRMCERLSDGGFNLIIPAVKDERCLFSYPTEKGNIHPDLQGWDPLKVLVMEAHERGLKVHPWICIFMERENSVLLERNPDLAALDREGKRNPQWEWGDPAKEEVQNYEFSLYKEIMDGYEVDGIHLDYIRYRDDSICFCNHCKEEFARYCVDAYADPAKIDYRDQAWSLWVDWRASNITRFVERVSKEAKKRRLEISAAVFPNYPDSIMRIGQDWALWAEKGYVDLLFPMTYTNSLRLVTTSTRNHVAQVKGASLVWEGLAPWLPLTTQQLAEEVRAALKEGAQGIVLFCYHTLKDSDIEALKDAEREMEE